MSKKEQRLHTGQAMEYFRIVMGYGSLFRMDVRTGKTWILGQKELIWREVAEEKNGSVNRS